MRSRPRERPRLAPGPFSVTGLSPTYRLVAARVVLVRVRVALGMPGRARTGDAGVYDIPGRLRVFDLPRMRALSRARWISVGGRVCVARGARITSARVARADLYRVLRSAGHVGLGLLVQHGAPAGPAGPVAVQRNTTVPPEARLSPVTVELIVAVSFGYQLCFVWTSVGITITS